MQGLLLLDKPEGVTSYGAVARIKRISGEKRVGHTGTLDPLATGVLPVLLGRATALSSYLLEADKSYSATMKFGVETDTCDGTGKVLSSQAASVTRPQAEALLARFCGEQEQIPPMFSALKQNGVPLYRLARDGKQAEIPSRRITVYALRLQSLSPDGTEITFSARVSKGTYIRSLCRDMGRFLGCGATLTALRRTATSGFSVEQCVSLSQLTPENLAAHLLSAEQAVQNLPAVTVTEKQGMRFCHGGQLALDRLKLPQTAEGMLFRIRCGEEFLGIGRVDLSRDELAVRCVIKEN
ncbi:MAG: tRNA pseudouridine(55) synthase TruB [Clostridia bacterium]|nr:tRNA pseudouridine(55) synthase TruB [Clostridia bacterium]